MCIAFPKHTLLGRFGQAVNNATAGIGFITDDDLKKRGREEAHARLLLRKAESAAAGVKERQIAAETEKKKALLIQPDAADELIRKAGVSLGRNLGRRTLASSFVSQPSYRSGFAPGVARGGG